MITKKRTINELGEHPQTYAFKYATCYRTESGIEWVIVAKSVRELKTAWMISAPITCKFDPRKVSEVRVVNNETKTRQTNRNQQH